jgi:hypothetical protein
VRVPLVRVKGASHEAGYPPLAVVEDALHFLLSVLPDTVLHRLHRQKHVFAHLHVGVAPHALHLPRRALHSAEQLLHDGHVLLHPAARQPPSEAYPSSTASGTKKRTECWKSRPGKLR